MNRTLALVTATLLLQLSSVRNYGTETRPTVWYSDLIGEGTHYTSRQIAEINTELDSGMNQSDRFRLTVFVVPRVSSLRIVFIDLDSLYQDENGARLRARIVDEVSASLKRVAMESTVAEGAEIPNKSSQSTTPAGTPPAGQEAAAAPSAEKDAARERLVIDSATEFTLQEKRHTSLDDLEVSLKTLAQSNPKTPLLLIGADQAKFGVTVAVLDACRKAGLSDLKIEGAPEH
jgi:biopolymer transport protein ExbD